MRVGYYIAMSVCALLSFSACEMQEEIWGNRPTGNSEVGVLTLDVLADEPVSTKALVATKDFPVVIQGTSEGVTDSIYRYNLAADFPGGGLKLLTGTYLISAHSNATLDKVMTEPYYHGEKEVTIQTGVSTRDEVICKMKNTKIEVALDDEFSNTLSNWEMTVNDGSNTAISFSSAESKRIVYYLFENEVKELQLNIQGTLRENGQKIHDTMILTKEQASEKYDDVSEYFEGGEALKINLKLDAATEGGVKLDVTASIFFSNNYEQDAPVDVVFPGEEEENPNDPTTPEEPSGEDIVFSEPNGNAYLIDGVTFKVGTTAPSNVQIDMAFKNGLQNLYVLASSTNEGFADMLNMFSTLTQDPGLDLTSDEAKEAGLGGLFPLPEVGATTYSFSLSEALFDLMGKQGCPGTHSYTVTAVDSQGERKSATLRVTIVEPDNQ